MIFAFQKLEEFFQHLERHYNVYSFTTWERGKGVILRHDVDFSLESAVELARREAEYNITSTYFVRTTGYFYNVLTKEHRENLKEITELGFEVGLHFDPTVYETSDKSALSSEVHREADLLESITGQEVKSISLHNPSITGEYPLFDGFNNAYDPKFFSEEIYISDSRMKFERDIYKFVEKANENTVQILLHPIHYSESGYGYLGHFQDVLTRYAESFMDKLSVNSTFRDTVPDDFFDFLEERFTEYKNRQ